MEKMLPRAYKFYFVSNFDHLPTTRARGYKTFFMLNSTEHEIFLLINVTVPTIVGILTFMSGKNSILGLSEPETAEFVYIFIYMSNFCAQLS